MSTSPSYIPPSATPIPPPRPVNSALSGQFTKLFGGDKGAGATGVGALTDIASGKSGMTDINQIFDSAFAARSRELSEGTGNILEQFGASGMRFSPDAMRSLADYRLQADKNLNAQLSDTLLKSQMFNTQARLQAGGTLEETFGNAAMTYAPSAVVSGGASGPSSASQVGSMVSSGASIGLSIAMLAMLCWVGMAVWGKRDPRVFWLRCWIFNHHMDHPLTRLYAKYGKQLARWCERNRAVKGVMTVIFNLALRVSRMEKPWLDQVKFPA